MRAWVVVMAAESLASADAHHEEGRVDGRTSLVLPLGVVTMLLLLLLLALGTLLLVVVMHVVVDVALLLSGPSLSSIDRRRPLSSLWRVPRLVVVVRHECMSISRQPHRVDRAVIVPIHPNLRLVRRLARLLAFFTC